MRQIRRGVFETNSSSVHSMTMCMKSDYDKWVSGDLYWDRWGDRLVSKDIAEDILRKNASDRYLGYDKQFYTYDEFHDYDLLEYETFVNKFKTPSGEEVVGFGYYGSDY